MARNHQLPALTSHFFTIRIWREELEAGRVEWRGKVQHVLTDEARYFRRWENLIEFIRTQVDNTNDLDESSGQ